jgi:myo-inositol-1-phosphate synthase
MSKKKVRVAILGVENCASSLVQGVEFYKNAPDDAIHSARLALDRGLSGPIIDPSSCFFKTPPQQFRDDICREKTEAFIKGEEKTR